MTPVVLCLLFITAFFLSAADKFSPPANSSCACPNQVLTFQCIVAGNETIIATLWRGSAFSCPETDANEILLRHSKFDEGTEKSCNNNSIIGQSLSEINQTEYSSQLTVRVGNNLNNKTVGCFVHLNTGMNILRGESLITVTSEPINSVPTRVILTYVETRQLVFTWNAVDFNCSSLNYITNSNCSTLSCVTVTDTAAANCSGLQLPSVCTFSVQTEVCGQIGLSSDSLILTLRVPDKPTLGVIPIYSSEVQDLLRIKVIIQQQASFNISDTMSGSITSYNVSYNSQTANTKMFDRNTSCVEDACEYDINLPSDLCQSSNDISVTLSASNRLGQGLSSNSTMIGCINQFVQVEYDRMTSTITCKFLDELDTSVKSCNVTYGQCGQELVTLRQLGNYSTMKFPNMVYIKLPVDGDRLECYNVTASSDVFTVIIQAMDSSSAGKGTDVTIVVAVVVPVIVVAIMVIVAFVIVFILLFNMSRRKQRSFDTLKGDDKAVPDSVQQISQDNVANISKTVKDIDQFELRSIHRNKFNKHLVSQDCELRDFVKKEVQVDFKRGCAFYEFVHDFEDISEDKEVILYYNEHPQLYSPNVNLETEQHSLIGHKVPKPRIKDYSVFVQSTGSGARHLPAGSTLLYESQSKDSTENVPRPYCEPQLKQIISSHFELITLPSAITLKDYCENSNACNILELGAFERTSEVIDVMLQDKNSEALQLYTGPSARRMVEELYDKGVTERLDRKKWRVFVLCKHYDSLTELKPGTKILQYKNHQIIINDIHVWTAGETDGCSSLTKFVQKKLNTTKFINGNAFYEFKREEDFQYYKEVIFWKSGTDKFESHCRQFYDLAGVQKVGVKPPSKIGVRVFIQSTSQGARCVKPGDTILYKKEPN